MDAKNKYNLMTHTSTGRAPVSGWNPRAKRPSHLLPFGTTRWVPIPPPKSKGELSAGAQPAKYLYALSATIVMILLTDTLTRTNYRRSDFRPLHRDLDPTTAMRHAFRAHYTAAIPLKISSSTAAPPSISHARRYPDADFWEIAHNEELEQLDA